MYPDELKQVWQSQDAGKRLMINPDVLLQQVERNKRSFEAMILWRDVQEVGASLVMVPLGIWFGLRFDLPWTWWLCIPAMLWIAGFMIVDRIRQRPRQPMHGDPLRTCAEHSLAQVQHQVWLLRNVFWWYLLPPGVAMCAFFAQCAWSARGAGWGVALFFAGCFTLVFAVWGGVYWLNRNAVRCELEPRQRELQSLLASLDGGEFHAEPLAGGGRRTTSSSRWGDGFRIVLGLVVVATMGFLVYGAAKTDREAEEETPSEAAKSVSGFGDAAVTNVLITIRQKYNVPAMAAALVTSKGITSVGVVGTRKRGTEIAATLDDTWHLGSDTKAMTATLMAKLVEEGKLNWGTTLAEVFPELASRFDPEVRTITVLQLLSHRSGLPANPDLIKYGGPDGRQERRRILENELSKPLAHKPGTHYEYSNLGYAIAGAIAEKITGKTWEQAMQDEVFGPLGMKSVGFGGMGTPGQIDQPWPHSSDGQPKPANGPTMDNPPVLSPAGRVHCTIQDWAKFIADQLRGDRGEQPSLLKPESYRMLHTPPFGGDYALGWLVVERSWGGGQVLHHAGDNTMNFANVWIAPKRDFAALACVNQSGDTAFKASDAAVGALIKLHSERAP